MEKQKRRFEGRIEAGVCTPQIVYQPYILQALVEFGGSAPPSKVLARVEQLMQNVLKEVDYQPLSPQTKSLRWRKMANWSRKTMVDEKLIEPTDKTGRGVWKITDVGRATLTKSVAASHDQRI
jgi:Mrr N-terminal domain